jgi:hypothetical protein
MRYDSCSLPDSKHEKFSRFAALSVRPQQGSPLSKKKSVMENHPAGIDIVRRAYELWQQAGEPKGRDQEFYHNRTGIA